MCFISPEAFEDGPGVIKQDLQAATGSNAKRAAKSSGSTAKPATASDADRDYTVYGSDSAVDEIARDLGLEEEVKAERKRALQMVRESAVFDLDSEDDAAASVILEDNVLQQSEGDQLSFEDFAEDYEDGEEAASAFAEYRDENARELKNILSHEINGDETFWFLAGSKSGEDLRWSLKLGDTDIVKSGKIDSAEGNAILYRAPFDSIYRIFRAEGDGVKAEVVTLANTRFMAKHSLANVERSGDEVDLSIEAITEDDGAYAEAEKQMRANGVKFDGFALYDISFKIDDSEYEPKGKGQIVDVALRFDELPGDAAGDDEAGISSYTVEHLVTDAYGEISEVETVAKAESGLPAAEEDETAAEAEETADNGKVQAADNTTGSHLAVTAEEGAAVSFAMDSFSYVAVTYENGGALKAPSRAVQYLIDVILKDFDYKNDLTAAEIGDGFNLVYYEFPASAYGYDPASGQAFTPPSPIYNQDGTVTDPMAQYKMTFKITDQTTELELKMKDGASTENPYVIYFGDIYGSLGTMGPMGPMGGFPGYYREWLYGGLLYYDGETAGIASGNSSEMLELDGTTFTLKVRHDDSDIYPTVLVTFDASDYIADQGRMTRMRTRSVSMKARMERSYPGPSQRTEHIL